MRSYDMAVGTWVIDYQIPDNWGILGYIKWPNSPLHHRVSITCFLLVSTHSTYIIIMVWFNDNQEAYDNVSLSFAMWGCVVLIATGSSTKTPPSTRLTSVMSSLLVLLHMRLPRHMRIT
ncbi:hypothetical protein BGY98DRAFT_463903 [Russula aff. rugulosa BPL654]|nr:hypothetical protein BGY98DRAFT_463903 [Russula aff. rugulosa BPL654]